MPVTLVSDNSELSSADQVASWEEWYYKLKTLVRPLSKQRRLLERVKYLRTTILSPQEGNDFISDSVGRPFAVGKIGSSELAVLRYFLRRGHSTGYCKFPEWQIKNIYRIAGVYPPQPQTVSRFCRTFSDALKGLDVLAVWFNWGENAIRRRFANSAIITGFDALEPYYHKRPWSAQLKGKRVLVISPFVSTIEHQYKRREEIWPLNRNVLPEFTLLTLRSPLSAFLRPPEHSDWFSALRSMQEQMSIMQFDVAIIGAGAWSIPLVAYAKELGAWTIHLGGTTQILFGIKGGRWDSHKRIAPFYNKAWTRPSSDETPSQKQKIEGGCYW